MTNTLTCRDGKTNIPQTRWSQLHVGICFGFGAVRIGAEAEDTKAEAVEVRNSLEPIEKVLRIVWRACASVGTLMQAVQEFHARGEPGLETKAGVFTTHDVHAIIQSCA